MQVNKAAKILVDWSRLEDLVVRENVELFQRVGRYRPTGCAALETF